MLTVVTGPPCSGKTTHVRKYAQPGDLIVDYDAIAVALGSPDSHDHPEHIKAAARDARQAAIKQGIGAHHSGFSVWIIDGAPNAGRRRWYRRHGADIVELGASREELHRRARDAGRPARWHHYIDQHLQAQPSTESTQGGGLRAW